MDCFVSSNSAVSSPHDHLAVSAVSAIVNSTDLAFPLISTDRAVPAVSGLDEDLAVDAASGLDDHGVTGGPVALLAVAAI